jgi:hypothetical protein
MLGSPFNLAPLGLNEFSVDLSVADGRHAIDAVTRATLPKWREYDTDLIYRFPKQSAVPNMPTPTLGARGLRPARRSHRRPAPGHELGDLL